MSSGCFLREAGNDVGSDQQPGMHIHKIMTQGNRDCLRLDGRIFIHIDGVGKEPVI
jgi:hypothetical protein